MFAVLMTLLWTGLLAWLTGIVWTAWVLLRPPRLTPARAMARLGRMSPSDLGLRFEDGDVCVGQARRRVRLVYWFIPASPNAQRTVVLIHGYADSRIGALTWAPVFLEIGWNVLAVDLRGHGESEGTYTTAGILECHDLVQLIDDIWSARPQSTGQVMLFGASMGAAVALATAAMRDDLAGVIIDSPVANFYHGAATQLSMMGLGGKSLLLPGLRLIECGLGRKFASIAPARLIPGLSCPVLAMCPGHDPFLPPEHARELEQALAGKRAGDGISRLVRFDGAGHLQPIQQNPDRYKECLNQFCDACTWGVLARRAGGGAGERSPRG